MIISRIIEKGSITGGLHYHLSLRLLSVISGPGWSGLSMLGRVGSWWVNRADPRPPATVLALFRVVSLDKW